MHRFFGAGHDARKRGDAPLTGLQPGSTPMFRYRFVLKTGAADWSQPVSLFVK